jgi:hypothetical protein
MLMNRRLRNYDRIFEACIDSLGIVVGDELFLPLIRVSNATTFEPDPFIPPLDSSSRSWYRLGVFSKAHL